MQIKQPIDLLIEARWVLPMAPGDATLESHAVAVADGRIVALGATAALGARFAPRERIVRADHVLLPGLTNAHARLAGGDAAGGTETVRERLRLQLARMLLAGITSFASDDPFPQECARVAGAARMRAAVGLPLGEPGDAVQDPIVQLARAEELWDEHRSSPWVSLYFAPASAHLLPDATLARVRTVADELDARVAMPVHASTAELERSRERFGRRPLERLAALGFLRPGFTAVHLNEAEESELELIARTAVSVVLTPQADARRARGSGLSARLIARGVLPGLGSGAALPGAALDVLAEARCAALLGAAAGRSAPQAPPAREMGPQGGACALGLGALTGSIEPGKAADLVAVELDALSPCAEEPHASLVYGATRAQVSDVWIGGRAAVAQHQLLAFDAQELRSLAARERTREPTLPDATAALRRSAP